jgi:hypothetical protein
MGITIYWSISYSRYFMFQKNHYPQINRSPIYKFWDYYLKFNHRDL